MRNNKSRAFTLIEIMLVVVIIGILAAVIGPRLVGQSKTAKIRATKASIEGVKTALGMYEVHMSRFPTTEEGLEALLTRPADVSEDEWEGPYLREKALPKDAFGKEFIYRSPGDNDEDFVIVSLGPDGREGTDDDISSSIDPDA